MNKTQLLKRLKELDLDREEYWLITGGAMVLYGLRQETGDIDLGCTKRLADTLQAMGYETTTMSDGRRRICLAEDVELLENWLCGTVQLYEGVPVISLEGLLEMKKVLGREKDLQDIKLILAALNQ